MLVVEASGRDGRGLFHPGGVCGGGGGVREGGKEGRRRGTGGLQPWGNVGWLAG